MLSNLPDWVYKSFWTAVSVGLGYLATVTVDVGPEWTPVVAPVFNAVIAKVRELVDRKAVTA